MRLPATTLRIAGAVCSVALLVGCTPEPNGPPIGGPDSTEERTYSRPTPSVPPQRTPQEGCPYSAGDRDKSFPMQTSLGPVAHQVIPVFAEEPDWENIGYGLNESAHSGDEGMDPHKLLLIVVRGPQDSKGPLQAEDLEDFSIRPSEVPEASTTRVCEDPLPTSVRFIGENTPDEGSDPAGIWEITSDADIASGTEQVFAATIGGEDLFQIGVGDLRRPLSGGGNSLAERPPAVSDQQFYFENR